MRHRKTIVVINTKLALKTRLSCELGDKLFAKCNGKSCQERDRANISTKEIGTNKFLYDNFWDDYDIFFEKSHEMQLIT